MEAVLRPVRQLKAGLARSGRISALYAFIFGLLTGLAFPPLNWAGVYAIAFILLFFLLEGSRLSARPIKSGFWRGWWFGVGMFLAGLWWIANAFFERGGIYAWFFWVPVILMPVGLALFWGAAGALYARWAGRGAARLSVFVAAFSIAELARATILSGFPWNLPAHIWVSGGTISQTASLIGVYGLSVLTLLLFALPLVALEKVRPLWRLVYPLIALLGLVGMVGFGHLRLALIDISESSEMVRVVQLNLPQSGRRYENREEILQAQLELSSPDTLNGINTIIWPEGAVPTYLLRDTDLLEQIEAALPVGTTLIAGTNRADTQGEVDIYYNALAVIDRTSEGLRLSGLYDKAKLVPFGEGNPVVWLTRPFGFQSLSTNTPFFSPGEGALVMQAGELPPFQPLICYEVIYPGYTRAAENEARWLLNISNDSWYGQTTGPWQHLNIARYRTIETGLPLVRSASAGVSGLVDPLGRAVQVTRITDNTALDIAVPNPLDATPYKKYGDLPWVLIGLALLFLVQWSRWRIDPS